MSEVLIPEWATVRARRKRVAIARAETHMSHRLALLYVTRDGQQRYVPFLGVDFVGLAAQAAEQDGGDAAEIAAVVEEWRTEWAGRDAP